MTCSNPLDVRRLISALVSAITKATLGLNSFVIDTRSNVTIESNLNLNKSVLLSTVGYLVPELLRLKQ